MNMAKPKNGPKCPKCGRGEMIFREIKDGANNSRPVLSCPECKHFMEVVVDYKDEKFQVDMKEGLHKCPICNNPLVDSSTSVCMPGFRKGDDWLHIQCVFVENTQAKRSEFAAAVVHHNWLNAMKMLIEKGEVKQADVPNLKPWCELDAKEKQNSMDFMMAIEEAFGNWFQGVRAAMQINQKLNPPSKQDAAK